MKRISTLEGVNGNNGLFKWVTDMSPLQRTSSLGALAGIPNPSAVIWGAVSTAAAYYIYMEFIRGEKNPHFWAYIGTAFFGGVALLNFTSSMS